MLLISFVFVLIFVLGGLIGCLFLMDDLRFTLHILIEFCLCLIGVCWAGGLVCLVFEVLIWVLLEWVWAFIDCILVALSFMDCC